MIYLIGLDHGIQYTNADSGRHKRKRIYEFTQFLLQAAHHFHIELFAEEFSEYALAINNATACTVRDTALSLGIEHRFCDPDKQERQVFRISDPDKRQMFWLLRLCPSFDKTILFACGDSHIDTFRVKLEALGIEVGVLGTGWGSDILSGEIASSF